MPKAVIVIVANPHGADKVGEVAEGFYLRDGDTITMTDRHGTPLRDEDTGGRITHRLAPDENEKTVAKRLTLRLYRAENREDVAGFGRRIDYGRNGYA
jgi:hypothetical protein